MKLKTIFSLFKTGSSLEIFSNIKKYRAIENSGLFDEEFYKANYDCGNFDPLLHYLFFGYKQRHVPSLDFDTYAYTKEYLDNFPRENPIVHYVKSGKSNKIEKINKKKHEDVFNEILEKNRKNLSNFELDEPLVSIIILNKNGLKHLERLFKDFKENTNYSNYEIIVVDNNSTDASVDYLKEVAEELPLRIIENKINESFSAANNQGFKESNGDLILLMNNDMETTYGWLNELVGTLINNEGVGAVGPKLIYPFLLNDRDNSYKIQSAGDSFGDLMNYFNPLNSNKGHDLWDEEVNRLKEVVGITGAAFLTTREIYEEVGGLDEDYYYCYEDVDFCLKLNKVGYKILYAPNALIVHFESPTRRRDSNLVKNISDNRIKLNNKWEDFLFKSIWEDKLEKRHFFTNDDLVIKAILNDETTFDIAKDISSNFDLEIVDKDKINFGIETDILISFNPDYDPLKAIVKNHSIKIAWILNDDERWLNQLDFYDFIIYSNKELFDRNSNENKSFIDIKNDNVPDEFKKSIKDYVIL